MTDFEKKSLTWVLVGCVIAAVAIAIVATFTPAPWYLGFLLSVAYIILSLRRVEATERGLITLFGKPQADLESGLHFVAFGFCKLITITRNIQQQELPGEPEKVWDTRTPENEAVPLPKPNTGGFVLPIRINFAGNDPDPLKDPELTDPQSSDRTFLQDISAEDIKADPLRRRLTVTMALTWSFQCSSLSKLVEVFGEPGDAVKTISDMVVVEMTDALQRGTLARAQAYADVINAVVLKRLLINILEMRTDTAEDLKVLPITELNKLLDNYAGIVILKVQRKPFGLSHKLNEDIMDAAGAVARKSAEITKSEGEKVALTNRGRGVANATLAMYEAQADGQEKVLSQVGKTAKGMRLIELERTQMAMKDNSKIVVVPPGKEGNLFGAAIGVSAALTENKKNTAETPPPVAETKTEGKKAGGKKKVADPNPPAGSSNTNQP